MSKRTNQGGSVIAYIIVGVLLVAALVEGVYLLRWRSSQLTKQPASSKQDQTDKKTTKSEKKTESPPKTEVVASKPATSSVNTTSNNTSENAVLPTTGIETDITIYLGLFTLTYVSSSYLRSRKQNYGNL